MCLIISILYSSLSVRDLITHMVAVFFNDFYEKFIKNIEGGGQNKFSSGTSYCFG